MGTRWTVVKVGGSVFDLPDLPQRLQTYLGHIDAHKVVLLPGGGATADAVRTFDRVHRLGEQASHWLAIQALSINARFLQAILPGATFITDVHADASALAIIDPLPFFLSDEASVNHLPHLWSVTSDSLAVRAATLMNARDLVLLKSVAWEGSDWNDAAQAGVVDGFFAEAVGRAPATLRVRIVNLRAPCQAIMPGC